MYTVGTVLRRTYVERVCALQHFYVLLQLYRLDIATKKLARAYMIPYIYLT